MILSCKYTIYISNNYYVCTTFFQPNKAFEKLFKKKKLHKYLAEFLFITDKAGILSV